MSLTVAAFALPGLVMLYGGTLGHVYSDLQIRCALGLAVLALVTATIATLVAIVRSES